MNKFYIVLRVIKNSGDMFENKEAAINDAKRRQAADRDNQYSVMESIAVTKLLVPNIELEETK